MAFTRHGHHIPGSPSDEDKPEQETPCGGIVMCRICASDVDAFVADASSRMADNVGPTSRRPW